jgi:DNA-binding transcriptional regulator/RsmH inhibitor MraZ
MAGIKDKAVVVFLDNYMEVWGERNWELELISVR